MATIIICSRSKILNADNNTKIIATEYPNLAIQVTKTKTKPKTKTKTKIDEGTYNYNYIFIEYDCLNCGWNGLVYNNPCECPRNFWISGGETVEEIANIREEIKEFNRGPNEFVMK